MPGWMLRTRTIYLAAITLSAAAGAVLLFGSAREVGTPTAPPAVELDFAAATAELAELDKPIPTNEPEETEPNPLQRSPSDEEIARTRAENCSNRAIRINVAAMAGDDYCAHPVRLTLDDLVITVARRPDPADAEQWVPEVTIRRGSQAPFVVQPSPSVWGHSVTVGRLDRSGARYVMIQGYTGGFHCCVSVEVALPDGPIRHLIRIGYFEAGYEVLMEDPAPGDIDGDGHADFVARDNRFFYEFTSYNGTHRPPPQVWNIRDGRAVDVSGEPRYRDLFVEPAAEARSACLASDPEDVDRSACAAFVAAAARFGSFDRAWREVRRVVPSKYRDIWSNSFFGHLRRFLRINGYLGPIDRSERDDFAHTIHFPEERAW